MLTIHRAERADALIGPLAGLLADPPLDPFVPEMIAVPTKGVERWLMQQLSLRLGTVGVCDGVAANILFPSPKKLVDEVIASLAGLDTDNDPWSDKGLIWAILRVMDECVTEPWCAIVAHHLGLGDPAASHRHGRRFSTALKLAQLFTAYGDARPSMLNDWLSSEDTDGYRVSLRDEMAWQAAFWRRLREQIGTSSPAERLAGACAALREQPNLIGLPERLSVFGPTRLTRTQLSIFEAIATRRDLHLWLTHPSPAMWDALRPLRPATRRADDHTALDVANPLLANLSRDVREMQQLLSTSAIDLHHEPVDLASSVLARIQDDIRNSRSPALSAPVASDQSVAIYACHGHVRQVEVLREALLHRFNDDRTLEARDVIVLCPDVDTFAPLIAAAFGPTNAPHPGHRLRVRLADRGPAQTNPLLQVLQTLLKLADGRVTASEVLDLVAVRPVTRRFGISESDLETIRRWIGDAGARWGIGQAQRGAFGLPGIRQNTFSTARDRLLLGVSADESELAWLGTALPLDDVDSSDVDLAGRFVEFLDRLDVVLAGIRGPHSAHVWSMQLTEALDLLVEVSESDIWQRNHADRFLREFDESARDSNLTLPDMRAMLADEFRPRPTKSNFRTGDITVATMVPMRFVPHRVVAVIGLDDEAFPRVAHVEGDDILSLDPCLGERDPRSEDRQLLLDALMSAKEHLLLFYTGADPVNGSPRPAPAPLADVIDTVTATVEPGAPVVIRQPLQAFATANFTAAQPFSFDREAYSAALAGRRGTRPRPLLVSEALTPVVEHDVALDDLVDFLTDPTKGFLQQRLGVSIPRDSDEIADALPLSMAGLPAWHIGERLLHQVLAGATMDVACQAELRRGTLPPGRLGMTQLDSITTVVTAIGNAIIDAARGVERGSVQLNLDLGRQRLTGTVGDLYGSTLICASYSTLAPKHRIAAWVRLLALGAQGLSADAIVIGRHNKGGKQVAFRMPPNPAAVLAGLLKVRAAGLQDPLPLGPATSYSYAERRRIVSHDYAREFAAKAWASTFQSRGENAEKSIRFVYGSDAPFSVWWDQPALGSDQSRGDEQPNRFAQLAVRVFGPLIDHEQSWLLR